MGKLQHFERGHQNNVGCMQRLAFFLALLALRVSQAGAKVQGRGHNETPEKHWTQAGKPEDRGWSSDRLADAKA
jgi:hypothetical protein